MTNDAKSVKYILNIFYTPMKERLSCMYFIMVKSKVPNRRKE
jgi:hypothetical protein